jgi:tRNA (adenine57-N1/adenine58-N1)-methyltransferase
MKDLPPSSAVNMLPTAEDYVKERTPKKVKKVVINDKGEIFYVRKDEKVFHTRKGIVDLSKESTVLAGEQFFTFEPSSIDEYHNILRVAQIPPSKDMGMIVSETGINKESLVTEAGAGSGGLTCFLAKIAKKVSSYEIREDYYDVVKKNIEFLGLENVSLKNKDFNEANEKNQDIVILDMPSPKDCLSTASKILKRGGFLVLYLPCITQVEESVSNNKDFIHMKTIELIEREWHVEGMKVRPKSQGLMHSAFLTFLRKK